MTTITNTKHRRLIQDLEVMRLQLAMARDAIELQQKVHDDRLFMTSREVDVVQKALAALDDSKLLEGYVLCSAEPVAFMRDAGEASLSTMAYCIPASVKEIWLKVNKANVERYTVPLYARRPK
jgi:hypothetical protein